MMGSDRQLLQNLLYEAIRFSDFIESHGDPRCDIALGAHDLFGRQIAIRIAWQIAAQVKRLSARAPGKTGQPQLSSEGGRDDAGPHKPVAQSRVLVIDRTQ